MHPERNDTIAAIATPPGSGGIGIVRISGPRAKEVLAAGADSLAVISALYPWPEVLDLTSKPDIVGSVRAFLEVVTQ